MENFEEEVTVVQTSPEVTFQQELALIDKQVATAKQYPRNITKAINNAIAIVTMDMETAESCSYALKRWDKKKNENKIIAGPSVHLARIIAQCWGNMRVETKIIDIGATQVTSEGMCWDLESNLAVKTQTKRSITSSGGYRFSEDMIVVTGNAASAISFRNVIYAVVPKGAVNKIEKAAKSKITGDLSDETKLIAKRKAVFDKFKDSYGVTEAEVLGAVGKASIDNITSDDIVVLIGIGTALKDGDTNVEEAFRAKKKGVDPIAPSITIEELKAYHATNFPALSSATDKNAKRIIENLEVESYDKIYAQMVKEVEEEKTKQQ
jgi:uncharacterized protein (UPF0147 family)